VAIGANALDNNPRYHYGDGATARHGVVLKNCRDSTITGLHVYNVHNQPAGIVLEDCRRINVTGCSILDCDNAGLLLKNVTNSRVSNCLVDHDEPTSDWTAIRQIGGKDNVVQ
jgi:parallel beta-helix repeat protein